MAAKVGHKNPYLGNAKQPAMKSTHTTTSVRTLAFGAILLCAIPFIQGQEPVAAPPTKIAILRATYLNGNILQQGRPILTTKDENGHDFKAIQAASLEYGWQFWGGPEWHQACKYPRMGIGLQYLHIMNRNELGHPISIYGFYDGIYWGGNGLALTNRIGLGLAGGMKKYSPADLMPRDIFSTRFNAFIELGLGLAIRLNQYAYFEPGFRLTHFSNGNVREPQKGLNIVSYSLGLRSPLGQPSTDPIRVTPSQCLHRHEVVAYLGMSTRQVEFEHNPTGNPVETYDMSFLMSNLHLGYNYEFSQRVKLGGGFDLIYDGTNGQKEIALTGIPDKQAIPLQDKMRLSAFVGGESVIDRLSVMVTLGYMVAQTEFIGTSPAFEQRLGVKYHFGDVFAGINLRAYHFRAAEAVEFNVGMRRWVGGK